MHVPAAISSHVFFIIIFISKKRLDELLSGGRPSSVIVMSPSPL